MDVILVQVCTVTYRGITIDLRCVAWTSLVFQITSVKSSSLSTYTDQIKLVS